MAHPHPKNSSWSPLNQHHRCLPVQQPQPVEGSCGVGLKKQFNFLSMAPSTQGIASSKPGAIQLDERFDPDLLVPTPIRP